jgi:glycosyltransferase involved in cell wall biosynthesis
MDNRIKVLLTTEGTYPYHQGGVSTWCDILVKNIKNIDYIVYSIMMNPFVTQKFNLPEHASLQKLPLWGTEEPSEHLATPFSEVYLSKRHTNDEIIEKKFLPLFIELMREILNMEKDPANLATILINMYNYFKEHEYKKTFKSQIVWDTYKKFALDFAADSNNMISKPSIFSGIQSLGWIYRFLNILNSPVPEANVSHSAAAAFCGIPCVLAKKMYKTPMILTEHGIYLREQYLSLGARDYPSFLGTFLVRLIHSVTSINYHYADLVSPVCAYNTRWERRMGVEKEKIEVIYNGIDKNVFLPDPLPVKRKYPTVVTVARIDPLKDILMLLKAAAEVKKVIPDVRFMLYGSVSNQDYYKACLKLKDELNLHENFIFAGHTDNVNAVYNNSDIIALTSISEAFPYSVVEAMMVGKPVISTDVGGIREALSDTGMLVNPADSKAMADGIIKLIQNPDLRSTMGEEARNRALNLFTINDVLKQYFKNYIKFATSTEETKVIPLNVKRQKLYCDKAYALLHLGQFDAAIENFRKAVEENKYSPASPVILMEIAGVYKQMGQDDIAEKEIENAQSLSFEIQKSTA